MSRISTQVGLPAKVAPDALAALEVASHAASNGVRVSCDVCGEPFKKLAYAGEIVYGCASCWHVHGFEGPPPCTSKQLRAYMSKPRPGDNDATDARGSSKSMKRMQSLPELATMTATGSRDGRLWREIREEADQAAERERDKQQKNKFLELRSKAPLCMALDSFVNEIRGQKLTERELFNRIDANSDGVLSLGEMHAGLRKLGCNLLPVQLDAVLRAFDADGNGDIDFEEFYELLQVFMEGQEQMERDNPPEEDRMCGFEQLERVVSRVQLSSMGRDVFQGSDEGVVVGPGTSSGQVMVRFDSNGVSLSMRVNQLRRVPGAGKPRSSLRPSKETPKSASRGSSKSSSKESSCGSPKHSGVTRLPSPASYSGSPSHAGQMMLRRRSRTGDAITGISSGSAPEPPQQRNFSSTFRRTTL